MKTIFSRIICIGFILTVASVQSVRADMDYEIDKLADKAQWSAMFRTLHERGFDSLSGFNRYVYVAVSHLAREDAIGYEYEKKLTDSDFADVSESMPKPDGMYLSAGEVTIYAAIMLLRHDYDMAFQYLNRGASILEAEGEQLETMEQSDSYASVQAFLTFQGVEGVINYHKFLQPKRTPDIWDAYAKIGEEYRLAKEIEKLAAQILDTTAGKDSSVSNDFLKTINDTTALTQLYDRRIKNAWVIDSMFAGASSTLTPWFRYHRALGLTILGKNDAMYEYFAAAKEGSPCYLFWKTFLEQVTAKVYLDDVPKLLKSREKEEGAGSDAMLFLGEYYIVTGSADKAISIDTKFLKVRPNHPLALAQRAHAWYEKKEYVKASADASASVAVDSTCFEGWNVLALIAQMNNDPKAKEYFQKVHDLAPVELHMFTQATEALEKP